jgi:peptide/nickel transport system permease protein
MPVFYVGLILLITLAAGLGWFPVGGIGDGFFSDLHALFLPALTLAFSLSAVLMRNLRTALIGVLQAEFISFARAKGLPRRLLLLRHVLRNALVSTLTLLGINIGNLVGGAVITETVFAVPGIGRLLVDSIFSRDYAVVQGTTLVIAVMVSLVFLATDALQVILDPRVEA